MYIDLAKVDEKGIIIDDIISFGDEYIKKTPIQKLDNVKKILFINKDDLESKIDTSNLEISDIVYGNTIDEKGLDNLKNKIIEMFNLNEIKSKNYNFLSNARQIALVRNSLESIENAIKSVEEEMPLEMISVDIKKAYDDLGEIIGATYKDELLDELFSKFC